MIMNFIELIKSRRSIRQFSDKEVEFYKIADIIEAGMYAPNAGNLQNWKFIVVKDQEMRNKIAEASVQQYWMAEAPVMIVICAENKRADKYYGDRGVNLYNIENCSAAAQNMLLAATSMGLSSCWIGAFNEEVVKRELSIPEDARPLVIIPVGYSSQKPAEKQISEIKEIFYFEKWGVTIQNLNKIMGIDDSVFKEALNRGKKMLATTVDKLKKKRE
jgi:SagB-type dehydrogenase family enzyme